MQFIFVTHANGTMIRCYAFSSADVAASKAFCAAPCSRAHTSRAAVKVCRYD